MRVELSSNMSLDLQSVLTGRCCVIGQSGSGKSYLVGVIAEELSKAQRSFLIVDTEGEYKALKGIAKVITIGAEDADLGLDVDYVNTLTQAMEFGMPIVLDVSEVANKQEYVYGVLEKLYSIEETARKPFLVIIEEADTFVPQITKQKINIIEEISVRGRKRGIGLMVATQRPANISKNVLAQCSYGFIGKLTIENDINAVKTLLEDKVLLSEVSKLGTGEFIPFGQAGAEKFRVKQRTAKHYGATPSLGEVSTSKDLSTIINELKGSSKNQSAKMQSVSHSIYTLDQTKTNEELIKKAGDLAKKQFMFFGKPTESVESVKEKYLPLVLLEVRIPTGKRNEYAESKALISSKSSFVKLGKNEILQMNSPRVATLSDDDIDLLEFVRKKRNTEFADIAKHLEISSALATSRVRKLEKGSLLAVKNNTVSAVNYEKMLNENNLNVVQKSARIGSAELACTPPDKKEARKLFRYIFPTAQITAAKIIYVPYNEITLRSKNRVRIFAIDSVFGKEININAL